MSCYKLMGGATIVIGGDNVPPNSHGCGGQRGTKIIGDLVLYTCMKELRRENSNSENYQKMRIACLRQYRRRIDVVD